MTWRSCIPHMLAKRPVKGASTAARSSSVAAESARSSSRMPVLSALAGPSIAFVRTVTAQPLAGSTAVRVMWPGYPPEWPRTVASWAPDPTRSMMRP